MSEVVALLCVWLVLSFPIACFVGAFISYGMGDSTVEGSEDV